MLQPPLFLQSFFPAQSLASVLQPPLPLQSFLPRQQLFAPELPAGALEPDSAALAVDVRDVSAFELSLQPEMRPATAVAVRRARGASLFSMRLSYHAPANRSVARRSASRIPGSIAEWPASGTMMSSASGHFCDSSHALLAGQTTS
jgi:hypothetical protein